MKQRIMAAIIVACALAGAPAHAEDTRAVRAGGEAIKDSGSDADSVRVRAVDTALAEAVGQVLIDIVEAPARRRRRAELNEQVVRRARRFVAGFKVLEEGEADGRLTVRIEARVDIAKLRAELERLGVFDSAAEPAEEPRPKLLALVHESAGENAWASFGERGQRPGPAAKAMENRLAERGFALVSAAGQRVPIARELPEGLPLADESAAEMARAAGAGGALVVGVRAWSDGEIRGTPLFGARARAVVRVLDIDGEGVSLVGRVEVEGAGYGDTGEQAMAQALARAVDRAVDALAGALVAYWPPAVATPEDTLLVEVRGYRAWQHVSALVAGLSATRGIDRAWPRQVGGLGIFLAVRTQLERRRVAAAIERTALADATARADSRGSGRGSALVVTIKPAGEPPGEDSP